MQSTIKFTYSCSTSPVTFLYVTVKVEKNGTPSITLFVKPTASYQYTQANSSHPFHTMKALPKLQSVRVHRVFTSLSGNLETCKYIHKLFYARDQIY